MMAPVVLSLVVPQSTEWATLLNLALRIVRMQGLPTLALNTGLNASAAMPLQMAEPLPLPLTARSTAQATLRRSAAPDRV